MMTYPTLKVLSGCLLLIAGLTGCGGDSDDKTVPISGNVQLDGQPLPEGRITFLPTDGIGQTAGATITDGQYETRVEPGPKSVTIIAQRPSTGGKTPADPHAGAAIEQYLPAKYNNRTTLKAEVPEAGSDKIDFQLESR